MAALAEQQAAETRRMEDEAAEEADGGAEEALAAVLAGALAEWIAAFGSLQAAGTGAALAGYLARVRRDADRVVQGLGPRASRAARGALDGAAQLGARQALTFAQRAGGVRGRPLRAAVPDDAVVAARAIAGAVAEQMRLAARLLSPAMVRLSGWRGVVAGVAAAKRTASVVRSAITWCVHRAVNSGAGQAIAALHLERLWVAEPDACVRCVAYAGRVADPDGMFPGGLAADPVARDLGAARIDGPPRHVGCRCRVVPWRDVWTPPGSPTLPDLLRDRALRSIATGAARPSESRAARLRAARVLLAQPGVPTTVRRQAREAVAAGRF
jgi:hypothetical protein